jgi:hypothetical protein
LPLPECPGGPVWTWFGSPFPLPGRVSPDGCCCGAVTGGVDEGGGVDVGGGAEVGGGVDVGGGVVVGGGVGGGGGGGGADEGGFCLPD